MIPIRGYQGAKVAVLGLGRSGLATAAALQAGGAEPLLWDDSPEARVKAEGEGFALTDLTRHGALDGVAVLITSPGIPHLYPAPHPVIARALEVGVPVDNDIGLFFQSAAGGDWAEMEVPPKVIAVTGSNGKSTTTALIHHILHEAGRPTQMAGNIGKGVLSIDPPQDGEVIVLELSSYQTELARALTPDVAVFTNLSPDHLDRHAGMGGYFAAKARLFALGGPDRAVIGVDEAEGRFLAGQLGQGPQDDRVIRVSSGTKLEGFGWAVFARKGFLAEWRKGRQVASIDLREVTGLPGAGDRAKTDRGRFAQLCRTAAPQPAGGRTGRGALRERQQSHQCRQRCQGAASLREDPLDRRGPRQRGWDCRAGPASWFGGQSLSDRPFCPGFRDATGQYPLRDLRDDATRGRSCRSRGRTGRRGAVGPGCGQL